MPQSARLIVDPPSPPAWNMAVDEMLLERAGEPTLRFYAWSVASLSLGYFQSHAERASHAASALCPLVRRSTGGGAIVHDAELTYCFTAPCAPPWRWSAAQLYALFHETLIESLAELGARASLVAESKRSAGEAPFLCFARREAGDVLIDGFKVAGSAQRRRKRAVLQHGSVLLQTSRCAPELPGILGLTGRRIEGEPLSRLWTDRLEARLGVRFRARPLISDELAAAQRIESETFACPLWTTRR
jgi:lipoate-protein ligase A